jgi:hypothetical protein
MPENQELQSQQNQQSQPQQKSNALFLVSSAIHTTHGVYSPEQRLLQTIETCKSIRERTSDADIIIIDGGTKPLEDSEKTLLHGHIIKFFSYCDDPNVKGLHDVPSQDIVKNGIEMLSFGSFYGAYHEDLKQKYKRIFKVSGRYLLNDAFDFDKHMNATGKIIIRGPFTSQFPYDMTDGITLQYMSRLWSFDSQLSTYIAHCYQKMYYHFVKRVNNTGYVDIEHLLFHYLDRNLIQRINRIGVEGNIAPSGAGVSD